MACTRRTKTLVSTCVILSGMTNIVCLLYVGWVTNYIANIYIKVPMPLPERKLEADKRGDTVRIMERLDRLENVVHQHIQGKDFHRRPNSPRITSQTPFCATWTFQSVNTFDPTSGGVDRVM
ncbi:putative polypeptide N-acetylgalactosaminyltransferase 18-like [Scophthalmus maximus]|uniref:Putative polypeptide N-acetylgalactosaminyltransferase 18-like n=1 Tax=Scophthalmus maximus TaxID=52904 RepID=A0A2U9BC81_SCOMX|nr:putative polypeptide N-acetylgalactosaminyltransferase 18-like [Scophthalmus maximus]